MQHTLPTEPLTFARSDGGRLQIAPCALATMLDFVQDEQDKPESGGVLLGRHILNAEDIIIDQITTPMPGDRCSRARFFRARRRHQQVIDQAWRESTGTCTYLGEWHTHPECDPSPSLVDRLNWGRKLLVDRYSEEIFFVIVGTGVLRVWEGRRFTRPVPLQPV
jgi:integrative and conjugative element protein (TIGR02256 family)